MITDSFCGNSLKNVTKWDGLSSLFNKFHINPCPHFLKSNSPSSKSSFLGIIEEYVFFGFYKILSTIAG